MKLKIWLWDSATQRSWLKCIFSVIFFYTIRSYILCLSAFILHEISEYALTSNATVYHVCQCHDLSGLLDIPIRRAPLMLYKKRKEEDFDELKLKISLFGTYFTDTKR